VTLSFTEVDDGLGQPARYAVRFSEPPIAWGSAPNVSKGTCATPVFGHGVGARLTCTVFGLAPATTYEFQVAAYRSTLDLVEIFGDPSNIAQGTTPPCDCWTNKAFMPTARSSLGVADVNGTLYAVGGDQGLGRSSAAVEAYDPATDTWTTKAPMPAARYSPGVAAVGGILYVVGGQTLDAYDPATDTWTIKGPMPTPRGSFGVAAIDGIIYAVGGVDAAGNILPTLEAYDPATDTWTTKAPMPTGRFFPGVAAVNGVLYAVGGANGSNTSNTILEAYDPVTDAWTTKAPMPIAFRWVGAAGMGGVLYAEDTDGADDLKKLQAYDPATDTWTAKAPMVSNDMRFFGVTAVAGRLYAVGGSYSLGYLKAYQP
jgi:hypothetical protein